MVKIHPGKVCPIVIAWHNAEMGGGVDETSRDNIYNPELSGNPRVLPGLKD